MECVYHPFRFPLSFGRYWLYGGTLLEVVLLKPLNPQRRQLQVLLRPSTSCHILRPRNDVCRVTIPEMNEPFRIGIRAFHLQDESVGSFAMISDIDYHADICLETKFSKMFGGRPVPLTIRHKIAAAASEYSCVDFNSNCRWSNSLSTSSEWKFSNRLKKWDELMGTETRPSGTFFYQLVEAMDEKPYALLQSELIPCIRTVSSLSFRFA
ncbi:unnamed protein product [Toxocara canis]|uniref:MAM domain-containing protein n=1 Tax=Toxocara canis TaxID=6265 RepID=A0A183TVV2_TOXCA|nr:unnamed protein product [Toxocara canis]